VLVLYKEISFHCRSIITSLQSHNSQLISLNINSTSNQAMFRKWHWQAETGLAQLINLKNKLQYLCQTAQEQNYHILLPVNSSKIINHQIGLMCQNSESCQFHKDHCLLRKLNNQINLIETQRKDSEVLNHLLHLKVICICNRVKMWILIKISLLQMLLLRIVSLH